MLSKLPETGTSIFTVMSQLATEHGALNLAQGFPDFEVSRELIDLASKHMLKGRNQYAPSGGVPKLRTAINNMHREVFGSTHDIDKEITITTGATEALFSSISALIHPGDEVIVFDPAYDSYEPVVSLQQAKTIHIRLRDEDFSIDWEQVKASITSRTKAIIINNPHNPSGAILSEEDLLTLQDLAVKHELLIISDEVYNHIVFDGKKHLSVLQFPALAERSIAIFSFGKTFHTTGWKVGYAIANPDITAEIRKIHQFVTFTTHTPSQFAVADYLEDPAHYLSLSDFFQQKRELFLSGLNGSRFEGAPTSGTYFQLLRFHKISSESDTAIASRLIHEFGLATIPISVFNQDGHDASYLRFCFAKQDETLEQAARIMQKI